MSECSGVERSRTGCAMVGAIVFVGLVATAHARGDAGDPCIIDECPTGAIVEPDDCDFGNPEPNDQVNGGCNASPPAFTEIFCGQPVCGTVYHDGTFRDTDWWSLDTSGVGTGHWACVDGMAEFASVCGRVENGTPPGSLDCDEIHVFAEFVVTPACEPIGFCTHFLAPSLGGGEAGVLFFMGPDYSEIVDCGQPAGGPPAEVGERYVIEISLTCASIPCVGDFDGDAEVGFEDMLKILSNWGPCTPPHCEWDLDGSGDIGFGDLVQVLSRWGPCPPDSCQLMCGS